MTLSSRLIRLHEGLRLRPYRCTAGKLTIGYGRNLDANGIRPSEAEFMLHNDLVATEAALRAALPWVTRLDPVRYACVVDLTFNMGLPTLLTFTATLAALERGDYARASKNLLRSRYARQVPFRAARIAGMLRTGAVPVDLPE